MLDPLIQILERQVPKSFQCTLEKKEKGSTARCSCLKHLRELHHSSVQRTLQLLNSKHMPHGKLYYCATSSADGCVAKIIFKGLSRRHTKRKVVARGPSVLLLGSSLSFRMAPPTKFAQYRTSDVQKYSSLKFTGLFFVY